MRKNYLFLISCFLILLYSCKEVVPGFSVQLKKYLPYDNGDIVLYTSCMNDTIQFIADDVNYTEEHRHMSGCKCGNITELHGNLESEGLFIEYTIWCNQSTTTIDVVFLHEENILDVYSNMYPYNIYTENITNIVGDTINLQCDNANTMLLVKDKGIMYFYIDEIKYQKIL